MSFKLIITGQSIPQRPPHRKRILTPSPSLRRDGHRRIRSATPGPPPPLHLTSDGPHSPSLATTRRSVALESQTHDHPTRRLQRVPTGVNEAVRRPRWSPLGPRYQVSLSVSEKRPPLTRCRYSSVGFTEPAYTVITHDYALSAARAFSSIIPSSSSTSTPKKFVFAYLSGDGANQIPEKNWNMFGRVKGKAEKALAELGEEGLVAYSFRPAVILPIQPIPESDWKLVSPLLPCLDRRLTWVVCSDLRSRSYRTYDH
jgi:hypothetical protein